MIVPIPQISVDAMTYLKPELIGLAAWLSLVDKSYFSSSDRLKVLKHVARTGVLDGLDAGLLNEHEITGARAAHRDWLDYLAATDTTPKPAIVFNRVSNGNGHSIVGHPAQEDDCGDDIAF